MGEPGRRFPDVNCERPAEPRVSTSWADGESPETPVRTPGNRRVRIVTVRMKSEDPTGTLRSIAKQCGSDGFRVRQQAYTRDLNHTPPEFVLPARTRKSHLTPFRACKRHYWCLLYFDRKVDIPSRFGQMEGVPTHLASLGCVGLRLRALVRFCSRGRGQVDLQSTTNRLENESALPDLNGARKLRLALSPPYGGSQADLQSPHVLRGEPTMTTTDLEPIRPEEAVDLYLRERSTDVSQNTLDAHYYRLVHFLRWCGGGGADRQPQRPHGAQAPPPPPLAT